MSTNSNVYPDIAVPFAYPSSDSTQYVPSAYFATDGAVVAPTTYMNIGTTGTTINIGSTGNTGGIYIVSGGTGFFGSSGPQLFAGASGQTFTGYTQTMTSATSQSFGASGYQVFQTQNNHNQIFLAGSTTAGGTGCQIFSHPTGASGYFPQQALDLVTYAGVIDMIAGFNLTVLAMNASLAFQSKFSVDGRKLVLDSLRRPMIIEITGMPSISSTDNYASTTASNTGWFVMASNAPFSNENNNMLVALGSGTSAIVYLYQVYDSASLNNIQPVATTVGGTSSSTTITSIIPIMNTLFLTSSVYSVPWSTLVTNCALITTATYAPIVFPQSPYLYNLLSAGNLAASMLPTGETNPGLISGNPGMNANGFY
jgi:hypothetical protein